METRNTEKELRFITESIEIREDNVISGYAIVYNEESYDLGGFKEVISTRALDNVDLSDVFMYRQHDDNQVLGNTTNGTLTLQNTERGLYFSANMPDTTLGKDTLELVKRGDLRSMSFGFTVEEDSWDTKQTPQIRTVTQIGRLEEISIVNRPAYGASEVSKRAIDMSESLKNCKNCISGINNNTNQNLEEAKAILKQLKGQ